MIINFKKKFVGKILSGEKDQTIRPCRKGRQIKAGDKLQLYSGLRTKYSNKIADAICISTTGIDIDDEGIWLNSGRLFPAEAQILARKDGFSSVEAFKSFFEELYGLPFAGRMIQWELVHENRETKTTKDIDG